MSEETQTSRLTLGIFFFGSFFRRDCGEDLENGLSDRGGTKQKKTSRFVNGRMADRDPVPLPPEVRAKLAELELELSEGEYFTEAPCGE